MPVGQGFFHIGEVTIHHEAGSKTVRYIYDCGEFRSHHRERDREIDRVSDWWSGHPVNLVFLSHSDSDHINGIERMFPRGGGLHALTFVMPHVHPAERLMSWCATYVMDVAMSEFYESFIANPVETLRASYEGATIVEVIAGGTDDDDVTGTEDGSPAPDGWSFDSPPTQSPTHSGSTTKAGVPMRISDPASPHDSWVLVPHVGRDIAENREKFVSALAIQLRIRDADAESALSNTQFVAELLRTCRRELRESYVLSGTSPNASSMSLYSGLERPRASTHTLRYGDKSIEGQQCEVGWLGTGDAELTEDSGRIYDLLNSYRRFLPLVRTVTTPHHGSSKNRAEKLWEKLTNALYAVTAADPPDNWEHPSSKVLTDLSRHSFVHLLVSSASASEVREIVSVPDPPKRIFIPDPSQAIFDLWDLKQGGHDERAVNDQTDSR